MSFVKISPGVCGCGFMGKNHIRNYLKQDNVDFVYVYDVNFEIFETDDYLKSIGDNILVARTLNELKENANLISICSPSEYHYKNLKSLYNTNKYYIIEKPMFTHLNVYNDFKHYNPECTKNIRCGYIERFNPVVNELLNMLDEVPTYMEFKRFNPSSKRITGKIEYDLTIHDMDLLYYFVFNLYKKKHAGFYDVSSIEANYTDEKHAVYLIECWIDGNMFMTNISTSRGSMKKIRRIYIETEHKTYTANLLTNEIEVISKKDSDMYEHSFGIYTEEYETIIKNIGGEEPLYLELKDVIESAKNYLRGECVCDDLEIMDDYSLSYLHHKILR